LPLITRTIPSTGEQLPAMGIGTNSFRNANYAELRAVLKRMYALGGTVVDTAALYGESEGVIGKSLKELGIANRMFLATKFNAPGAAPPGPPPGRAPGGPGGGGGFPPPENIYGKESFERSLERLQTDHVDLLQAHFIDSVEPLMPLMQQLKKAGKARYLGITTITASQHVRLLEMMRKHPVDFVQVGYSLGSREAAASVLPLALERKIAVMVAVPLGGRSGPLIKEAAGRELPKWAADFDATSWSQFFLKYVISHPAVTCAIPGSSQLEHLEDNQLAGRGRLPDAATRKRMEDFWDGKA